MHIIVLSSSICLSLFAFLIHELLEGRKTIFILYTSSSCLTVSGAQQGFPRAGECTSAWVLSEAMRAIPFAICILGSLAR